MWHWLARLLGRDKPRGKALGRAGERLAAGHLQGAGYRVLGRNIETTVGEADLVCLDPDGRTIVVVEVKTRVEGEPNQPHINPEASVGAQKQRKLLRVAGHLAATRGWQNRPVRIDVIAIDWSDHGHHAIRHYAAAVVHRA